MTVLAIDSATPTASAALWRDGELVASFRAAAGSTHSECLLPMIEKALEVCEIGVADLDLIACGVGPGSFTGVRIGVATAKGLAAPRGIPCVGVSSLEAAAYPLSCAEGLVVPAFNARRGNVYTAIFSASRGAIERLTDDAIISVGELCETLAAYRKPVHFAGDAAREVFAAAKDAGLDAIPVADGAILPDAGAICAVAAARYEDAGEDGRRAYTAEALAPTYLRPGRAGNAALPE